MALIQCVECNKELSEKAASCPHCGCPNNQIKCPECSTFVDGSIDTCPTCGYPFKAPISVQPSSPPPVSAGTSSKPSSGNSSAGCFTAIGAVLIIICVIITAGHPGAKVFGVSAIILGIMGAMLIKELGNR